MFVIFAVIICSGETKAWGVGSVQIAYLSYFLALDLFCYWVLQRSDNGQLITHSWSQGKLVLAVKCCLVYVKLSNALCNIVPFVISW